MVDDAQDEVAPGLTEDGTEPSARVASATGDDVQTSDVQADDVQADDVQADDVQADDVQAGTDASGGTTEKPEEDAGFLSSPRGQALTARALKVLPWGSLVIAVGSAVIMDRTYKSAWMVFAAALLGWGALVGFALLSSLDPEKFTGKRKLAVKAAAVLILVVTQSLMQQCLFFSIPFYLSAASLTLSHVAFLVVVFGAAAITMWDPLYEAIMKIAPLRFFLMAFSVFVGLNAVIPVLGMGNGMSLKVSALVAGLGVPVQSWLLMPREERPSMGRVTGFFRRFHYDGLGMVPKLWAEKTPAGRWARLQAASLVAGILVPIVVVSFVGRLIPPAPLELVHIQLQTERSTVRQEVPREIVGVPAELNCVTWIWAPGGFNDELVHVWRKDGKEVDRVPLKVVNKRQWAKWRIHQQKTDKKKAGTEKRQKWGFRTNSRKKHLTRNPIGLWSCSVETSSGQLLGITTVTVR